jgi:hypothetical protein
VSVSARAATLSTQPARAIVRSPPQSRDPSSWIAWALLGVATGSAAVALLLVVATLSSDIPARGFGFRGWVPVVALLWAAIGARIAARQPRNAVGWLILLCGSLWAVTALFEEYATYVYVHAAPAFSALAVLLWFNTLTPTLVAGCSAVAMLLLPDGRLPSRRWAIPAGLTVGLTVLVVLGYALVPRRLVPFEFVNPFALPALGASTDAASELMDLLYVLRGVIVVAPAAALLVRLRGARGDHRRQLLLVALAASLASATFVLNAVLRNNASIQLAEIAALALVPIAFALAITRYRLYEIDRLLNRAFAYGAATTVLATFYLVAISVAQRFFVAITGERSDAAIIIATAFAALAFTPLKNSLQAHLDARLNSPVAGAVGLDRFEAEVAAFLHTSDRDRLLLQFLTECVVALDASGGILRLEANVGPPFECRVGRPSQDAAMSVLFRSGDAFRIEVLIGPRNDGLAYSREQMATVRGVSDLVAESLTRFTL